MITPKEIVIAHMKAAVPERTAELISFWEKYNPHVVLAADSARITLNANKDRIEFDSKTMEVFWLIGFSAWRAIECYSPHVVVSAATGQPVARLIQDDAGLDDVERDYKERRAAAQTLIDAKDATAAPWPGDIPRPSPDGNISDGPKFRAAFDLTCLAVVYTLFHEFRHVMLDRDNERPRDLREEEMGCDVWAREFMTAKLASYAGNKGHQYHEVLQKRSMGIAIAALILHEITPSWEHGGNCQYFSVADRLRAILDNTPLPANNHFWVFAASLLIGIFRQRHAAIDAPAMNARGLALYLLERL